MPDRVRRSTNTLPVQDNSDPAAFLQSALRVWKRKHPDQAVSSKQKGGRPSKAATIEPVCKEVWDRYTKAKPSLGRLIDETRAELQKIGNHHARNTIQKHVVRWLQGAVAFHEVPKELFRRNSEVQKLVMMTQALHEKRALFIKAFEEIGRSSPRPYAKKKYPPKN